jgi:uncharacterized pyridoxal phosphate-containing UPF0001 family protein
VRLASELGRRCRERPVPPAAALGTDGRLLVFVEVNLGEEAQKAGCAPAELGAVIEAVQREPALSLVGLMAIPRGGGDPDLSRAEFQRLGVLRERHGGRAALPELSIGMSRDLEVAVECGSSWVRVGTDIFGART